MLDLRLFAASQKPSQRGGFRPSDFARALPFYALLGLTLSACDGAVVVANHSDAGFDGSSNQPNDAQAGGDASRDASGSDGGQLRDAQASGDASRDGSDGGQAQDAQAGSDGSTTPTFAAVQSVVLGGCSGPPGPMMCHGRAPFADGLDLVDEIAYGLLVNAPALEASGEVLVKPGKPDESFLLKKLLNNLPEDGSQGEPMPKGEAIQWMQLPDDQIQLVRDWIRGGAPGP